VARALAGDYHVRTLSRNPDSAAAQALAATGVEVLRGDISDAAAARAGLAGAEVVFLVTQFWEHFDMEREFREGKVFIDELAATPSVKKFVFSTLEDVAAATGGKITGVHHFDGKGKLTAYVKERGIRAVFIHMAAYMENPLGFFVPRPDAEGALLLTLPDMGGKPYNHVSVNDTGAVVAALLAHYDEYVGKIVPVVAELATMEDICATISRHIGRTVKYNPVPNAVFAGFGFPGAADLADMFAFYRDGPCDRDPATTLKLHPAALTGDAWVASNKAKLLKAWGLD
jgi:uncharacterized protein YbjT (DUF2867 family)